MSWHTAIVCFIALWYSTEGIYHNLVVQSYVSGQFHHFQVVAIMINATNDHFCAFFDKYLEE